MTKSRVLVVDDAVVFRRLISDQLNADPELEVTATAVNGRVALEKLQTATFEAVVLDVEMPELDGIATLRELRKRFPRLPVIMFSTLTERGAETTLDALALGANDYFPKPSTSSVEASLAIIREQLVPKLKALIVQEARRAQGLIRPAPPQAPAAPGVVREPAPVGQAPTRAAPMAAATPRPGGPVELLVELFTGLGSALSVPALITQHMPPLFTRMLAERLTSKSMVKVTEATDGEFLKPGVALIAPGDFHLEAIRDASGRLRARLHQGVPENSCRPAVDPLFRSAATVCGAGTLGVILTGMGEDGRRGAGAIRGAGGRVLAQDEASSVVWGMPGAVARAGLAEAVLPLTQLPQAIVNRLAGSGRRAPVPAESPERGGPGGSPDERPGGGAGR
jgi:two-component system chemotaxis response regulator CheB